MSESVRRIVEAVRTYPGLLRKQPIGDVFSVLRETHRFGDPVPNWGDDAAAVPWDDGYLLVAADGIMTALLVHEPYAAGKASVMVTVNDIFAMGGRPVGLVNVLASGSVDQRRRIVAGIAKGCEKLQVPMLGGHLHPDALEDRPALSVTIVGRARKLLHSHRAEAGDDLVAAVDLDGRAGCRSVVSWDANSGKSPEALRRRLEAMPVIAESGLACAAKDVSNAGLLGTAAIMAENSGLGAVIDLDALPRPASLSLEQWILCFQSFGFVLSVPPANTGRVVSVFAERGIEAAAVGRMEAGDRVRLSGAGRTETLFDFSREAITGIRFPGHA